VPKDKIMTDEFYMKRALSLARKGEGRTSPNPMVGAVIVKKGCIIGEGYHRKFGENHAEINAINSATEFMDGAIIYVTLEPCSHYGKTPPCVDRIIESGAQRVVIGVLDPNPVVSGKGIKKLNDNGIATHIGVLEDECRDLNEKYFKYMTTKIPFVTLKYAQTIDGRIASSTGHSKWISSQESLRFAHKLRARHDAVLVGADTVIKDDPELTVRLIKGRNPLRVIVDSTIKIPYNARILKDQENAKTLVATTSQSSVGRRSKLKEMGVETLIVGVNDEGRVDHRKLLAELGKRGVSSVLVEGGSKIITSFVRENLSDRLVVITAPKILGQGVEAIGDLGIKNVDDSIRLTLNRVFRKGDDIIMDLRVKFS
jgi:diaminohydroxyphosphoribosylaminopyrimidine deaminase/5-amino-6-(5-phosphoribosylamino)uracil reductase